MPNHTSVADEPGAATEAARPKRRATTVLRPVRSQPTLATTDSAPDPATPGVAPERLGSPAQPTAIVARDLVERTEELDAEEEDGTEVEYPTTHPDCGAKAERRDSGRPEEKSATEASTAAGDADSSERQSSGKRDHAHRLRNTRRKTQNALLTNEHSRLLVDVVRTFGVIDMRIAIEICRCIGGATTRYYTMRVKALDRADVLRRLPSRDLRLRGLLGRSPVLVAGDKWSSASSDTEAPAWSNAKRGPLIERLALAHLVAERVLNGWTLVRGNEWVAGLATLDRTRTLGSRAHSVSEALREGLVRFKEPAHVLGLLPPTGEQYPALLVGGGATPPAKLATALATARRVAPIEVICFRRSAESVIRVRRVAMAKLGGAGDSFVTVLPSPAGMRWKKQRRTLANRLEAATGDVVGATLATLIGADANPSGRRELADANEI